VDLDAFKGNLRTIQRRTLPRSGTPQATSHIASGHSGRATRGRILLVLKADAYGHGAVTLAHAALREGVWGFGVSTAPEALELRAAGIHCPILILGTVIGSEVRPCLEHDVHIGLHSSDRRRTLQHEARALGRIAKVHLNVDTGMSRLGVPPERALELARGVAESDNLTLAGTMTHIAASHGLLEDQGREQVERFDAYLSTARSEGLPVGLVHAANSAATFTGLADRYDAVRTGIAALGEVPPPLAPEAALRPVMSLRSQVVFLRDVARGTPVGYGATWHAPRDSRLATISIGFDDGVPWRLTGCGEVLIRGQRAPIIGTVCMDYVTLDVTPIRGVQVGDVATLIGRDGEAELSLREVASRAGTIPYEVASSVGKRVPRIYHQGDPEVLIPAARPSDVPAAREFVS